MDSAIEAMLERVRWHRDHYKRLALQNPRRWGEAAAIADWLYEDCRYLAEGGMTAYANALLATAAHSQAQLDLHPNVEVEA